MPRRPETTVKMMKTLIKKCAYCNLYTAKGFCPKCNEKTLSTAPPKYSPQDKYGELRRAEVQAE